MILIIAFCGFMRFSKSVENISFPHKFSASVHKTNLWRKVKQTIIRKRSGFMFQFLVTQLTICLEAIRISDNSNEEYMFRAAS